MRTATPLKVAVVGAGPAGLSAACALGERGHRVTLFEQSERVGGQFLLAAAVPGKEEFWETLRYFRTMLDVHSCGCAVEYPCGGVDRERF